MPDYDAYFDVIRSSPLEGYIDPKLVLEASRGCWWGARKQCTFCGLNGSTIEFRSKPGSKFAKELWTLVQRHHLLDVVMVDNILDNGYFESALPEIASWDLDLRIHFEVKSNLTAAQIAKLHAAGVVHIQPGIESLSSSVLKLMRKGVSGVNNVRTLRDATSAGVTTSWNYLYGFPDEPPSDYELVIDQIPRLVHLQPPSGANRIALERFSPNFDDVSIGFAERQPAECYRHVYDLQPEELARMVYLFETPNRGISGDVENRFHDAIATWRESFWDTYCDYEATSAGIVIRDAREEGAPKTLVLESGLDQAAFDLLLEGVGPDSLSRRLAAAGIETSDRQVLATIQRLDDAGLLYQDAGRHVAVPTRRDPNVRKLRP